MKKALFKIWPIGIIFFLWILFAFPYWGKGLVPFPSTYLVSFFAPWSATYGMPIKNNAMPDVITQIYPWKRVTMDAWKQGELPLWNPNSFSGTNHVGNYQSAIFSPMNLLFFVLPEVHAWSVMVLLQPLIAGIGMYLFLRALSISRGSRVISSVSYMFCGFMTVWMAYGTLSFAVAYLPIVLYGIYRFIIDNQKIAGVWIATGICASFVSGHFQMSVYVLLYAVGFSCYLAWKEKRVSSGLWALVCIAFGIGLAAPQIIPSFSAYSQAVRSSLFIKGEVIPWQYIVTLFSPDFYGNPVTRNDWFGHYAEWASFVGVAPLLLAVLAMTARIKKYPVSYFVCMFFVSLLLAFQTPLVDLLFALQIPVLSTSSASRIIVLMSFSLAVLSSYGGDVLYSMWEKQNRKKIFLWLTGVFTVLVCIWGILLFLRPLPPDKLYVATRNTYLPTLILIFTAVISGLGLVVHKKVRILLFAALIMLTCVDMYRFASKWMPFDPVNLVYPQLPVITKLQSLTWADHTRIYANMGNELGSSFGLQLIEGYDAVYQYRYGKLISSVTKGDIRTVDRSVVVFDKHGVYSEPMLELLGVRYYAHKKSDGRLPWAYPFWEYPQYDRIWQDDNFEIFENSQSLPRAFLASGYVTARDDEGILRALYSEKIDRRTTLVLEQKPEFDPMAGHGVATISSYRPTEVVIHVDTTVPKLLFLSDTYESGWKATIDGKRTNILRADFDFRAVAVPKGNHVIVMRYMPKGIVIGFWIAGFATLGIMAFYIWKPRN